MFRFDYLRPASIMETCSLLSQYGSEARVMAGGTDLMVQLRARDKKWANIKYIIDLTHIKELMYIRQDGGYIRIGALTTHDQISRSGLLNEEVPFLREAAFTVGSPQIRNTGTLVGGICNASPAADPVPPLVALEAEVVIESVRGPRTAPLASIYAGPYINNIGPDEFIAQVKFKRLPPGTGTSFIKLGRRNAAAISRLNVACAVQTDGSGRVTGARISPGCVFPVPGRVRPAEEVLLQRIPTEELIAAAGKQVSEEMIKRTGMRWSTGYKQPVLEALTRRAIKKALGAEWDG